MRVLSERMAAAQQAAVSLLPAEADGDGVRHLSTARRIWTLIVVLLALALVQASLTALYPAAPTMAREIGASQTDITWIVDIYTLAMAGLLLPAGALGDRFGRRGVMNIGLGLFAVSSMFPLIFDSPGQLMAARAMTGVAAALIMPSTLSLITSLFPPAYRDGAIGLWTAIFALGGALGAIMAGSLLEFFEWRSVFWGLLIFAAVVFVMSLTIPSSTEEDPPPLDIWGSITGAVTIAGAVYGLIEAGHAGWSNTRVLVALGICLLGGVAFVLIQLQVRHPLLDVRLFAIRPFGVSAFAVTILFAVAYGTFFLAMQYQQLILGFSPLKSGLAICAMGFGILPVTMVCAWATRRFGLRWIIAGGFVILSLTYVILLQTDVDSRYSLVVLSMAVFGVGAGLNMAPCTTAIIDNVAAEKQGVAAAVNHTTREVGTALGVALCGSVLTARYLDGVREVTAPLPEPAREASRESLAGALAVAQQSGASGAPLARTAEDAFIAGMHKTFVVIIVLVGVTAVITALWGPGPAKQVQPDEVGSIRPDVKGMSQGRCRGVLRGRVTDAVDGPVAGVRVVVTDLSGRQLARTETDHRGRYAVSVTGVRGLVVCSTPGHRPYIANLSLESFPVVHDIVLRADEATPAVPEVSAQSIPLGTAGSTIDGVLRSSADRLPVVGAEVNLADTTGRVLGTTSTGRDGSYRFEGVPHGEHQLEFTVDRRSCEVFDVPAAEDVDVFVDLHGRAAALDASGSDRRGHVARS